MKISLIAQVLSCNNTFSIDLDINYLLTDSRTLKTPPAETLFFALRTSKNDGARYVADLYKRGLRAFVVARDSLFSDDIAKLQEICKQQFEK